MSEPEEWREVRGFPGYNVSSLGRIEGPRKILQPHKTRGYYQVQLSLNGKMHTRRLARLICEAFHGEPPSDKHQALHKNDIGTDNTKDNLYWGTSKDNIEDQRSNGSLGKLSTESAKKIRELHSSGVPQVELAKMFGVGQPNISLLLSGKTW